MFRSAMPKPQKPTLRVPLWPVAVALLVNLAAALFAPNRMTMAFWFVWQNWLLPIAGLLLLWGGALWLRYRDISLRRLCARQLSILALLFLATPLPLSCINLIPYGQTTEIWRGRVEKWEFVYLGEIRGYRILVSSETLCPLLNFRLGEHEFAGVVQSGPTPTVKGVVVRGFLGVPVAARLIAPEG